VFDKNVYQIGETDTYSGNISTGTEAMFVSIQGVYEYYTEMVFCLPQLYDTVVYILCVCLCMLE